MNKRFLLPLQFLVTFYLFLTGCATMPPTVSNIIHQETLSTDQLTQSCGNLKSYLIGGAGIDSGMDIACNNDGSCLLFGETIASFGNTTDYLAVKMSPDQKIVWAKTYDASGPDRALHVVSASDGGYLLVGGSKSVFTPIKYAEKPLYLLVIKIDSSGNIQWAKAVEYLSNSDFYLYNVIQTSDSGYVFSGYHQGKDPSDGVLLFKLNDDGNFQWGNYYRLSNGIETHQYRVTETADNKLAIQIGSKVIFGLFVADLQGKPLWAKTYRGEDTIYIRNEGIVNDGKGGFAMVAANLSGNQAKGKVAIAVTRVTPQGDVLWSQQYSAGRVNVPTMIMKGYDNDFVITGITGEGALACRYGDNCTTVEPVHSLMLSLDESGGKEKSSFLSTRSLKDFTNSASKTKNKFCIIGDASTSNKKTNFFFSIWQQMEKPTAQTGSGLFSTKPFKVKQEVVEVEAKPVELATIEIKNNLSVRELLIGTPP